MLLNHFRATPNHHSPAACLKAYVALMLRRTAVVTQSFEDMVLMLLSWAVKWAEDVAGLADIWPERELPAAKYRVPIETIDIFIWLGCVRVVGHPLKPHRAFPTH